MHTTFVGIAVGNAAQRKDSSTNAPQPLRTKLNLSKYISGFRNQRQQSKVLPDAVTGRQRPGVNFINILCQEFMRADSKSVNIQSSHQYLFALLGSAGTKALSKKLIKLTPGVQFTNILQAAFHIKGPFK